MFETFCKTNDKGPRFVCAVCGCVTTSNNRYSVTREMKVLESLKISPTTEPVLFYPSVISNGHVMEFATRKV